MVQFIDVSCLMAVLLFSSQVIKSKYIKVFNRVLFIKDSKTIDRKKVDDTIAKINGFTFLLKQFLLNSVCCSSNCFKKLLLKDDEYTYCLKSLEEMKYKIDQSLSLEYMLKNFNEHDIEKQKVDQELKTKLTRQLTSINNKSNRSNKLNSSGKGNNPFNILKLGQPKDKISTNVTPQDNKISSQSVQNRNVNSS